MGIGDVLVSSTIHNHDRRMLLPIFVDYGVANHTAVATPQLREVGRGQVAGGGWRFEGRGGGGAPSLCDCLMIEPGA